MKNIEEESAELNLQNKITQQVEEYMTQIEQERAKLHAQILKFETACISAGFKIAKIQYRKKDWYNEYGQEEWHKWDSH